MYAIQRTEKEIDGLLNQCIEAEEKGKSKFPGMTYEQGIKDGIDWLTVKSTENPLSE